MYYTFNAFLQEAMGPKVVLLMFSPNPTLLVLFRAKYTRLNFANLHWEVFGREFPVLFNFAFHSDVLSSLAIGWRRQS
jgi:hypothetical protein